jgi:hypothetical protein
MGRKSSKWWKQRKERRRDGGLIYPSFLRVKKTPDKNAKQIPPTPPGETT